MLLYLLQMLPDKQKKLDITSSFAELRKLRPAIGQRLTHLRPQVPHPHPIPHFLKVHFTKLHVYKRPTSEPIFTKGRSPRRMFTFTRKAKIAHSAFVLQETLIEAPPLPPTQVAKVAPPSSLPRIYTQHLSIKLP